RVAKALTAVKGPLEPVPVALLQALAPVERSRQADVRSPSPIGQNRGRQSKQFARFEATPSGVRGYLESHGVRVLREQADGPYTQLVLEQCPITGSEGGTSVAVRVHATGQITYHNLHASAVGSADDWQALRDYLEPGYRDFVQLMRSGPAAL